MSGKTGIPKNVLGKGLTAHALKILDREARRCGSDSDEELEIGFVLQFKKIYWELFQKIPENIDENIISQRKT